MAKMNPSKLRNVLEALPFCDLSNTKKEAIEAIITRYLIGDIVPVVRCKDCKFQLKVFHEDKRRKEGGYWLYFCYRNEDQFVCHAVNGYDDEFCCYGEKKEGDSDDL